MKRLTVAVLFGFFLTACGSDDNGPTTSPLELGGLWDANSIALGDAAIPVPSGEIYLLVENADQNPVDATIYGKSDENCLIAEKDQLTYVGNYEYEDGSGDRAKLVLNGNNLSMRIRDGQTTMNIEMVRTVGLSAADLPVCTNLSNTIDNTLFNDSTIDEPTKQFFSTIFEANVLR